ncbi:hypothetical protein [Helicobacter burdigaliensis]|uniref:hypothetical protein n=1 Tax=Helicobacter burdigaliensis TaxID=2315334 RepID=UPI001E51BE6D|nr:hypothetical protein [Helicobacter burdigaliensis]
MKSFSISLKKLQKSCLNNNVKDCNALAYEFISGVRLDYNIDFAYILYKKACNLKYLPFCFNLNDLYFELKNIDTKTFQTNLDNFILQKVPNVLFHQTSVLLTKDKKAAFAFVKENCDLGIIEMCGGLGYLYFKAEEIGIKQDLQKAREPSTKACKKNEKFCFAQAFIEINDNPTLAYELFLKSCKAGYYDYCYYSLPKNIKDKNLKSIFCKFLCKATTLSAKGNFPMTQNHAPMLET